MELLHISKSGGTSMCQLSKDAGLRNPAANINGNCLVMFCIYTSPALPSQFITDLLSLGGFCHPLPSPSLPPSLCPIKVEHFYDEPKWTRLEAGMDASKVWPAVTCPDWITQPDVSCSDRWDTHVNMCLCVCGGEKCGGEASGRQDLHECICASVNGGR